MGRYPPETRYAASSGAKIAYQASGTGPPDLILVPGLVRPAVGWSSLTEAELPVVRLAAEGHANADIAVRLCLSRYTVETHLKHVFAKLGVESRTELAALTAGQDEGERTNT